MTKNVAKMQLPKITPDDLFSTQDERDTIDVIKKINIKDIVPFPSHPFKVIQDENLNAMMESIIDNGILNPIIVRPIEENKYQLISGHRRKFATELLELSEIPAIVKNLTDDEATILMVDSNIQREELLPSEKAYAYKMKLEAIKHQGKRKDLTLSPLATKYKNGNSAEIISKEVGESKDNIYRYIRLTELIPELLEKVDNKIIAFRPAVELSYLSKDNQLSLLDIIDYTDATPSLAQALKFKKLEQKGELNDDVIDEIMGEEKPNQIEKMKFNRERIRNVLPKNIADNNAEDFVIKSIEYYSKYLKNRELNSR